MYELASLITKYILVIIIYIFIFRIVRLIYADIKMIAAGEATASMLPHLKLITPVAGKDGEAVADIYPLVRESTIIGRADSCSIWLPDQYLSSKHAKIEKDKDHFYVEDLKSANGTYLNNVKLEEPTVLKEGDRISLGRMDLIFSEGGR